ncbi:penicillin-binding transpeptidase domain-containing protein [Streptomyces tendae]|uniref:penicillin-binding transpeptidase domain-containing protein n=1 Tax=Streptomyces tendae TaxID=1932 RepID=UPI003716D2DD
MRNGTKSSLIGGFLVVMVGSAGYGAYHLVSGATGGTGGAAGAAATRTGPPTATEVRETAEQFLSAWAKGEARTASNLTNNNADAFALLEAYKTEAHISDVALTAGTPMSATVPYSVSAKVSYGGKSRSLTYKSEMTIVRGVTTHRPLVDWQPSIVHPKLRPGDTLRTGEAQAPAVELVDVRGRKLSTEEFPSLAIVLSQLRERYGDSVKGKSGIELWIDRADENMSDETLVTLDKGKPGKLQTTLDADVQAAAEKAAKQYGESSVIAIRPSTGEIRAVVNNRKDEFNAAMEGQIAPGSTMKIVTAAMLINNGLVTADGPAQCTNSASWYGRTFTNLNGFSMPEGETFKKSFARSCNTAFIKPIKQLDDLDIADTALANTAQRYFGIGQTWNTGIRSWDGKVPSSTGAETAASYIGQGRLQMNPLTMASITATAESGSFKQPVLLPQLRNGTEVAKADPLPTNTAHQLRQMMQLTATADYGTATHAMSTVRGDKGAKTGSAEVDGTISDSWFTGYSGDLAAAAVVRAGGHGSDAAGPMVAAVLRAGN